jgi:hypothetical protein
MRDQEKDKQDQNKSKLPSVVSIKDRQIIVKKPPKPPEFEIVFEHAQKGSTKYEIKTQKKKRDLKFFAVILFALLLFNIISFIVSEFLLNTSILLLTLESVNVKGPIQGKITVNVSDANSGNLLFKTFQDLAKIRIQLITSNDREYDLTKEKSLSLDLSDNITFIRVIVISKIFLIEMKGERIFEVV